MRNLLSLTLALLAMLQTGAAFACEKHLHGHQNNSDTNSEASQR